MRLLKSLHLKLPQQSSIVIFDASGSDTLERFSLGGRHRFEIVYSRFEHICAHPKIVFRTFLRYLSILYSYCFYNGQLRRSDILTAYYWAMLDQIRPKVVITFIDTVSPFYRLSRIVKGVTFIAVQNGNRWHLIDTMAKAEIPHFFCFGEFETQQYKRFGHHVDFFYPVGAIKGDYAGRTLESKYEEQYFDIVLVSQWREHIMVHNSIPDVRDAFLMLNDFLLRFVESRKLRLAIACAVSSESEINYYNSKFGALATVIPNSSKEMTTYKLMKASQVVVTNWSTAGLEALGWGKKTLFCNFSSNPINGFPTDGPWNFTGKDFNHFNQKLTKLIEMSHEEFLTVSKDVRRLHMKYPQESHSAGQLILQAIEVALKSPNAITDRPLI